MKKLIARNTISLLLLAGLMLAACQPSAATATTASGGGGAVATAPAGGGSAGGGGTSVSKSILLDPALATDADSQMVNGYLYEGLVVDQGGSIEPALAQSWTVSDDGLSYTFQLRPTAAFHSGQAVTADAVIANFSRWFDAADALHGAGAYAGWTAAFNGFKGELDADSRPKSQFDGIEKVDNLTVLVHLNRVDADFLTKIAQPAFAIVDPDALASGGYGTAGGGTISGTGPYRVASWSADKLELAANAGYWNGAPASGMTFELK